MCMPSRRVCTWRWESTLTTGAFVAASESIVGPRPCCLLWPPQLCMYPQTAPATALPPASGLLRLRRCTPLDLGHHCWLSWSLPAGPGSATEVPNSPCSHCGTPMVLAKDHTVVNTVDPGVWAQETSWPPTTLPDPVLLHNTPPGALQH